MVMQLQSEEDFESTPSRATDPSADINLGSHLPNPLNLTSNTSKVPSNKGMPVGGTKVPSSEVVVGGTDIILPIKKVPSTVKAALGSTARAVAPSENRDRINNVSQKEEAMAVAGVTRYKTYAVILRLLSSQKKESKTDKSGNVTEEWVDDLAAQARGAELALKAFGDMIEHKQVEYGIADSTLEKLKQLSVGELRGRAAELLAGRVKAVDVTRGIVVEGEVVR